VPPPANPGNHVPQIYITHNITRIPPQIFEIQRLSHPNVRIYFSKYKSYPVDLPGHLDITSSPKHEEFVHDRLCGGHLFSLFCLLRLSFSQASHYKSGSRSGVVVLVVIFIFGRSKQNTKIISSGFDIFDGLTNTQQSALTNLLERKELSHNLGLRV